jgi:monoamine oxidase
VGPTQRRVRALIDELGLTLRPTYTDGKHIVRLNGTVRSGRGPIPAMPVPALADSVLAVTRLEIMARTFGRWSKRLDANTFGAWMRRHVRTDGARMMLQTAVGATMGSSVDDISLLAFVRLIRSAGGLHQLTGVRGAAQDARIVGNSVSLCERLAESLDRDRIQLRSRVTAVEQSDDEVTIRIAEAPALRARRVITAVDPATCARIDFGRLPAGRRALHDGLTMGSGIKFHIAYAVPFWRHRGLSGQAIADTGPVRILFDATGEPDGPGVLVGFLGDFTGDRGADELLAFPDPGARAALVASEVDRLFGPAPAGPIDYCEHDWRAEPFLTGCVPAPRPGVLTAAGTTTTEPHGRLHWAGAESVDIWTGYMDGAVRSGERAARETL